MYEFRMVSVCVLYSAFILNAHFLSIQLISDLRANAIYSTTIICVWDFGVSVSWAKCIISRKFESWLLLLANNYPELYVYANCSPRKMWMNQFYCEWWWYKIAIRHKTLWIEQEIKWSMNVKCMCKFVSNERVRVNKSLTFQITGH